ncbi:MAG: methyl-accepting chemotaxis protein, partial [Alphaproteobacteria bacterium]|nr:methyl-accepting chemotaxis protein [Alphaproteobacteria bacterium]
MNIRSKLPLFIAAAVALTTIITVSLSYLEAEQKVVEVQKEKLVAVRAAQSRAIVSYLSSIREELVIVAGNPATAEALEDIQAGFEELPQPTDYLQKLYITENPHPIGEKDKLGVASDGSNYSAAHQRWHPFFHDLQKRRGYYDVFLIDAKGTIVYSVFKELDFATNLLEGQWKDSDVAKVFRQSRAKAADDFITFSDFAPYAPSSDAPASFMATPIVVNGKFLGVLAFQMPIGRINAIMQAKDGMGVSGETYIVGTDFLMRSDSRFSQESTILHQRVETEGTRAALSGKEGVASLQNYRGIPVFSSFAPVDFEGVRFAVISEIDEKEVLAPVTATRNKLSVISAVILTVMVTFGLLFARSISKPLTTVANALLKLAEGDTSVDVQVRSRDEVGQVGLAFQTFKQRTIEIKRLEVEQVEREERAELEKKQAMLQLADSFEQSVGGIVSIVSAAATELEAAAQTLNASLEETNAQASTVAAAANEASANVETVATACEELAASVREIGQQVNQSSQISGRAVTNAESTKATVEGLVISTQKIGEVVKLINDIAEQTNLLA